MSQKTTLKEINLSQPAVDTNHRSEKTTSTVISITPSAKAEWKEQDGHTRFNHVMDMDRCGELLGSAFVLFRLLFFQAED